MERFRGRHVVVTGGGVGIGKAIAERLAAEGATLSLLDSQPERLEQRGRRPRRPCGHGATSATGREVDAAVAAPGGDRGRSTRSPP